MTDALVIGGAGPIGSHVVDELLNADYDVVVLDNLVRGEYENDEVEMVEGDVRDEQIVWELVDEADVVFQLAALNIRKVAEDPREGFEVMVEGAFNVIQACAELGPRLVLSSSASLYGRPESFPTTETQHPWNSNTLYGAAKTFQELTCHALASTHELDYLALRYANVYGPRMAVQSYPEVLVVWMEAIDRGLAPVIEGNGNGTMDLVYVEDVARANRLAAESDWNGTSVNIGSGQETRLCDLAELLLEVMESSAEVQYAPGRTNDLLSRRQLSTVRAAHMLEWEPETDLKEGLKRTVDWWRSLCE